MGYEKQVTSEEPDPQPPMGLHDVAVIGFSFLGISQFFLAAAQRPQSWLLVASGVMTLIFSVIMGELVIIYARLRDEPPSERNS
jgi:hypothetical protein